MSQELHVAGMTCENCAKHVKKAILGIQGVREATVDLAAHSVAVETEREVAREEFAAAIDRAGYELR
jgi:Cu2+-exporting ATPase